MSIHKLSLFGFVLVLCIALVLASDTGLKSPSATGEDYNQWANPTNAYTSNNQYASETTAGQEQDYYNFNFGVPSGATINGVEVKAEGYCYAPASINGDNCVIKIDLSDNGGTSYGTKKSQTFNVVGGETTKTYGGSTSGNSYWGLTLTDTDFSNTNFRARIELDALGGGATTFYLDHIQVKVYYTESTSTCWSLGSYGYYIPRGCTCYISGATPVFDLTNAYCWAG